MAQIDYTTADTSDGMVDIRDLHDQIVADSLITTELVGVNQTGASFALIFDADPSAGERGQCDAVVAAHAGLPGYQDGLVGRIKRHRDAVRMDGISAEYPAASGNLFSCSTASQDNWSKLATLDGRGLVTYPWVATTADERGSYSIVDSADLTGMIGAVSSAVLAERASAQVAIDAVLASTSQAGADAAAAAYLAS